MVKYLLERPIAVFLSFLVCVIFGLFCSFKIPVSLLPAVDVPQIVVKIDYPNTAAAVIEENVTKLVREDLSVLDKVVNIESLSADHTASIKLDFEFGTKMDMAYVEVNEKIDRILSRLPKEIHRPQVIRLNTSDIPILRLHLIPKSKEDLLTLSDLSEKIIKKRLEQLDGVSLIDINGQQGSVISIDPDLSYLRAVGLTESDLVNIVQSANKELGSLTVKDGQYRFFVKMTNGVQTLEQLKALPVRLKNGITATLDKFGTLKLEMIEPQGYHLLNGKRSLVLTVQKQEKARMNELVPKIRKAIDVFRKDYPQVNFMITQDQSFLLEQGISNLSQDLWYGGFFCLIILFLFLGNYISPLLMSISIPLSLLMTFIFFYLFRISFNIISLSGLALGIGMLIDNSIVVLDNISRKRREGLNIDESCIIGVKEVASPIISNVLTTVAIYAPLIYLSGISGALVYDQAIALTISLAVSLLVAFCLNPVMYKYFLKTDVKPIEEDTKFYLFIQSGYHRMLGYVFDHKKTFLLITLAIMPAGFLIMSFIPFKILPKITETETTVEIDWNQPIDVTENEHRVKELLKTLNKVEIWESDIGITRYQLKESNGGINKCTIYYKCIDGKAKKEMDRKVNRWLKKNYPESVRSVNAASNAFTQLFKNEKPYAEIRFRQKHGKSSDLENQVRKIMFEISVKKFNTGLAFQKEANIELILDNNKMALFGVSMEQLSDELNILFGSYNISEVRRFGEVKSIRFRSKQSNMAQKLNENIKGQNGVYYPLHSFITFNYGVDQKYITSDKGGAYYAITFEKTDVPDIDQTVKRIIRSSNNKGISIGVEGSFLDDKILFKEMTVIFFISIVLLYLILAVQFESLLKPVIVMLTIPLGISGAMLLLWLSGGTLDIMAAIGFVVVLGIIVDDPSLKVETINRLRKQYEAEGMTDRREILVKALFNAGDICLKPLLMVSLTTSLALLPVLFTGGIGNDLQRPLVYVIIGGLSIGTFFTLWFIPLAYWFTTKK